MFPKLDLDIAKEEIEEDIERVNQGITYLYDFKKGDFILRDGKLIKAEGKEGARVWIEKILLTDEFKFKIYETEDSEEYGTTIRKLILGRKIPQLLLHSELKRIISEKMKENVEIERIEDFELSQQIATLTISFTVILVDGTSFRQEVNI